MVANRTTLVAVTAGAWSLPGAALAFVAVASGNPVAAVAAAALGVVAARLLLPRAVAALASDGILDAGEHAVHGTIDAIEVFWRPG